MRGRTRLHPGFCVLLTAALLGGVFAHRPSATAAPLRVSGTQFVDSQGAVVILRGVNLAGESKVPPFRHIRSIADLDPLPAWGINVLRLLFIWEAFEPKPGVYQTAYLDSVTQIVDAAHKRGMYVLIDVHQDAYSRYSIGGCGDGFPSWTLPSEIPPVTPDNGAACANWGTRMIFDRDMHKAFDAFHANKNGVRDRYLAMLSRVAAQFAKHPAVIGFDPINEPWGDEKKELPVLYADAARVIRHEFPDAILFIEAHALTSSGLIGSALPRPSFGNFAFAPHYYDAGVLIGHRYSGLSIATDAAFSLIDHKLAELGAPLFLGEYGAPGGTHRGDSYLTLLHQHLNRRFASGTQWNYTPGWDATTKDGWNHEDLSITDDKGLLRTDVFRPRPYAQRIPGTPSLLSVREATAVTPYSLELVWDHDPAKGTARLFAPRALFQPTPAAPVIVRVEGDGLRCRFDSADRHLLCDAATGGRKRVLVRSCVRVGTLCL